MCAREEVDFAEEAQTWGGPEEARCRHFNQEQTQSETVPKIVPSGGLFPFGSQLARMQQSRMNTGESKLRQITLSYPIKGDVKKKILPLPSGGT